MDSLEKITIHAFLLGIAGIPEGGKSDRNRRTSDMGSESSEQEHGLEIKEKAAMSSQVVLITGALTGIGRATALAFAREGARVVVSGRHDDEGLKLAQELRKQGTEAEFVRTDVRHEEEVKDLVDKTIARFGRL